MPRRHPIHRRTLIPSDGDLCPSRPSSGDKLPSPSVSDSSASTLESERSDAGIEDTKLHRNSPEPSVNRNTAKPTSKAVGGFFPISSPWPMERQDWHGLELDIGDPELRATADLPHIKESRNGKQSIQMKQKSVKKAGKKSAKKSVKSVKKSTKMQKMVINIMKNMAKKRGRGTGRPKKGKPKNVRRLDKGLKEVQSEVRSMSGAQLPRDAPSVLDLAVGVFAACLVAVLLFNIVWGLITEKRRYRAMMRKSGVALKCLFFLLRYFNVPIF